MSIVVLEPSCWSVLRDEIHEMYPNSDATHKIMQNTFLLSEFLSQRARYRPPVLHLGGVMHGHCHHKAIIKGAEHERKLLEQMEVGVRILTDGCCGMAGSFGYEKGKYDVSTKIGEHALVPAVQHSGLAEVIIADGFSCREQVTQMTDRHALHMAEVMQLAIRYGEGGPGGILPESEMVREHSAALRKSKIETGVAVGALALGAFAGAKLLTKNRHRTTAQDELPEAA
jgi:Fe-S oxidoreductase